MVYYLHSTDLLSPVNKDINMSRIENVNKHAELLFSRFPELREEAENLHTVYSILKNLFFKGKTLFICGNGGSAADGDHITGELLKSFVIKRKHSPEMTTAFENALGDENILDQLQPGLRAISLNNHQALTSAYINDMDPLMVYAQQLYALGTSGDVLLGISTSGNAKNIYNAFKTARALGITTILLTGLNHGLCEKYADHILRGPAMETYRIQEYHLPIYHTLCLMIEEEFYGEEK